MKRTFTDKEHTIVGWKHSLQAGTVLHVDTKIKQKQ